MGSDAVHALGVPALQGIRHAQDGGHFRHAHAVREFQLPVHGIRIGRNLMPVVAGQQSHGFHVVTRKAKNFTVQNDVLGMKLVVLLADERPYFMEDGG